MRVLCRLADAQSGKISIHHGGPSAQLHQHSSALLFHGYTQFLIRSRRPFASTPLAVRGGKLAGTDVLGGLGGSVSHLSNLVALEGTTAWYPLTEHGIVLPLTPIPLDEAWVA